MMCSKIQLSKLEFLVSVSIFLGFHFSITFFVKMACRLMFISFNCLNQCLSLLISSELCLNNFHMQPYSHTYEMAGLALDFFYLYVSAY